MNKRAIDDETPEEKSWVSAGKTRNWVRNDPLLDYLDMYGSEQHITIPNIIKDMSGVKKAKVGETLKESIVERKPLDNSHAFLLEQGNQFESAVLSYVKNKFPKKVVQVAFNKKDIVLESKANETLDLMRKGTPFIYQAVLHDWDSCTFGSPDFIVRSDYLHKLVKVAPLTRKEYQMKAGTDFSAKNRWHYVIVDVKYSTLKLRTDGIHLTNSGNMAAYKAQMYIYHRALTKLQGVAPRHSYLLGRNWAYIKNTITVRGNGPFERLGSINFTDVKLDKWIIERADEAVEWIRRVRNEGMFWVLSPTPSVYELYPNMSNKYDSPWHWKKQQMSDQLNEITAVWYCGVKQRKRAHDEGITSWTDPELTIEVMGFKKRKTMDENPKLGDIIEEILSINRQTDMENIDFVRPKNIQNNYRNWQNTTDTNDQNNANQNNANQNKPIELYVDFETVHSASASSAQSNVNSTVGRTFGRNRHGDSNGGDLIFMVGVGWVEDGLWRYRNFTATHMTFDAERKMLNDFYYCVKGVFERDVDKREQADPNFWKRIKANMAKMARLFRRGEASLQEVRDSQLRMNIYHWGHIEQHAFQRAMERHPKQPFADDLISGNWVNFYDIMRKEPIVVQGSLAFGLKSIVSGMHRNNLITTTYDDQDCANGIQAMAEAIEIYNSGVDVTKSKKMNSIIEYNEVDCKAVYEIIEYLRKNNGRGVKRALIVGDEPCDVSDETSIDTESGGEEEPEPPAKKARYTNTRKRRREEEVEEIEESESESLQLFE
jgi:hypothetical protein